MRGEKLFGQWQPQGDVAMSEMGSTLSISDHHLQHPGLLHVNWDQTMEQNSHFESAMSSIVSSPSNHTPSGPGGDSVVIHELIGRLGSICNSGEISPQSRQYSNPNGPSCYSTPLNSPPKLNLSMMEHHQLAQRSLAMNLVPSAHVAPFMADPGFSERAARFTAFGGRNYPQVMLPETGKLSRASSSKSMMVSRPSTPEDGREASSVSAAETRESNGRKRKAGQKGKCNSVSKDLPKVAEEDDVSGKKTRSSEGIGKGKDDVKLKEELSSDDGERKPGKESSSKQPEPPKLDYIHVRARRGQATDSHSLAERVRREKISERMKFLQNLVPGCNKVTGKAVMLDEIINYVQSLQRQVEFLSMKLATLNPQLDFNMDDLIQTDMLQQRGSMPHSAFSVEPHMPPSAFPFPQQPSHGSALQSIVTTGMEGHCSLSPMDISLRPLFDGVNEAAPQIGTLWEDDLHNFVHMSYGQNQELPFSSQPFHGSLPTTHMKIEL